MKRFGLVVNTSIPEAVKASITVFKFLEGKVKLVITEELHSVIKNDLVLNDVKVTGLDNFDQQDLDILIAIGGDGTILRTLHKCNVKIFGINAGVVGFLTEVGLSDIKMSLTRLLENKFTIDKRMKLKTAINDQIVEPATNEAVIHTADIAKMRLYLIQVDGAQVQKIRADGIIIATPTGSTSYSLSASGPILDPKVNALIINPIAPFKLSARPFVIPSSSVITIRVLEPDRNSLLVIDGQEEYHISSKDVLTFTQEDRIAEFVRFEPNFYKLIEEKLTNQ